MAAGVWETMSCNSPRCRSLSASRAIGSPRGETRESRAILHCQGTSFGARDLVVSGIVFSGRAAEGRGNKAQKALSLNKDLPSYVPMSEWAIGCRHITGRDPVFFGHSFSRGTLPRPPESKNLCHPT